MSGKPALAPLTQRPPLTCILSAWCSDVRPCNVTAYRIRIMKWPHPRPPYQHHEMAPPSPTVSASWNGPTLAHRIRIMKWPHTCPPYQHHEMAQPTPTRWYAINQLGNKERCTATRQYRAKYSEILNFTYVLRLVFSSNFWSLLRKFFIKFLITVGYLILSPLCYPWVPYCHLSAKHGYLTVTSLLPMGTLLAVTSLLPMGTLLSPLCYPWVPN